MFILELYGLTNKQSHTHIQLVHNYSTYSYINYFFRGTPYAHYYSTITSHEIKAKHHQYDYNEPHMFFSATQLATESRETEEPKRDAKCS